MTRFRTLAALLAFGFSGLCAAGPGNQVKIEGMKFNPPELHVKVGGKVTWVNQDIVPHTATADHHAFDSKMIAIGKSWSWKPKKKGSYPYTCSFHPTMKGLLVVE